MNSIRVIVAVAMVMIVAGCAGGANIRPDWVNGSDPHYPPDRYLIGRGQADNENDAANRARAELAKVFEVQIDEQSQDVLTYRGGSAGGEAGGTTTAQVTRSITTKTAQIINGIQVPEVWRDPETHTFYALAVLPRMQASNSLRQEIDDLDTATERYIRQARQSDDLLIRIAAADRALDAQIKRSAYQKSLKVVDTSGVGEAPRWNVAALRVGLDKLLHDMRIGAQAGSDPLGGLREDLAGGLSAAGFLVDTGKSPAYVLKASVDLTDPELLQGWYWMRGTLAVALKDPATGQVRGTHQWDIKVSAQQPAVVRQRARTQVRDILQHNLRQVLIGFAAGRAASS